MLTILTPSKTMNFTTPAPHFALPSIPYFQAEAHKIRALLARLSVGGIQTLMNISEPLAMKTQPIYKDTAEKQAFWAYDGDVFKGVQASSLTAEDTRFAQEHVVVPSAVYGLVRPCDLISPYRLEMKAKLRVGAEKDLYVFWADRLASYAEQAANGEILMLSSYEYARTIIPYVSASIKIVTPAFIDRKPNGTEAQVAIYNKMMRGVMARWVIDNRIDSLADIHSFAAHGYAYDASRSSKEKPVFYRSDMKPLVF